MIVLVRSPSTPLLLLAVKITRTASRPPKASTQEISQSRMYTERGMPHGPTIRNMTNPPSNDPAETAKAIRTASETEVYRQLPRLTAPTMKNANFAAAQIHSAISIGRKYWAGNAPSNRNSNARNVEKANAAKSKENLTDRRQMRCALYRRTSFDSGDISFPPGFLTFCFSCGFRTLVNS